MSLDHPVILPVRYLLSDRQNAISQKGDLI